LNGRKEWKEGIEGRNRRNGRKEGMTWKEGMEGRNGRNGRKEWKEGMEGMEGSNGRNGRNGMEVMELKKWNGRKEWQ
jgi:hypothetical protein